MSHRTPSNDWTESAYARRRRERKQRRKRQLISLGFVAIITIVGFYYWGALDLIPVSLRKATPTTERVQLTATTDVSVVVEITQEIIVTETPIPPTLRPTPFPTATIIPQVLSNPQLYPPELESLQQLMLDLINRDRIASGLNAVEWDPTLTLAGQLHVEEMILNQYFSHWNLMGFGPGHRYTLLGGEHISRENIHASWRTYDNGQAVPIEDWPQVIIDAQSGLMNSPGHRANILEPTHTHVGVGMAYDSKTGQFRLAQEFGNQWVQLSHPLPTSASLGDTLNVQGQFTSADISQFNLTIAYEPLPSALTVDQLNETSTYRSAATNIEGYMLTANFDQAITLDYPNGPGIYHLRIFANKDGSDFQATDHSVWVEQ